MSEERILPQSAEIEAAVLSAWSLQDRFGRAWTPEPELFAVPTHRLIALSAAKLDRDCRDHAAVVAQMDTDGTIVKAGGSGVVFRVLTCSPGYGDPWPHVQKLRELRALRDIIRAVEATTAEAYEKKNLGETIGGLQDAIRRGSADVGTRVFSVADLFSPLVTRMETGEEAKYISTGIASLDNDIGGFQYQQVTIVGADTSWGKTSYGIMVADLALLAAKRPLIVSFEDPKELYARRLAGRRTKIVAWALRRNRILGLDRDRLRAAAANAEKQPFFIEAIGSSVERAATEVRCLCAAEGIDIVIGDYLQAASCSRAQQDRRVEVTYVARTLTDAIKTAGAAGLLFSQFKRPLKRGEIPTKHDLKESGDLENAAENVLVGYLDDNGRHVLRSAKGKDGICGKDYGLEWNTTWCGFVGETAVSDNTSPEAQRYDPPRQYKDD